MSETIRVPTNRRIPVMAHFSLTCRQYFWWRQSPRAQEAANCFLRNAQGTVHAVAFSVRLKKRDGTICPYHYREASDPRNQHRRLICL